MARPESTALAGYFPTPVALLPRLASLVEFQAPRYRPHILVDPCAGTGQAIEMLRALWFAEEPCTVEAIELERLRGKELQTRFPQAHVGDAFHFEISGASEPGEGASILFLNPPYDVDREVGRLEHRFLERWSSCLAPGAGILVFLVPHYALATSARFLSQHFERIAVWRFPGTFFDPFRQCALLARRRVAPLPVDALAQKRLERLAEDLTGLQELPEGGGPLFSVAVEFPQLDLTPTRIDVDRCLSGFRPWEVSALVGTHRTVDELIGPRFPVALPPRPAHIALALAAGTLNGRIVSPDVPGLPALLVKGSFRREFVTVEEKLNREGDPVGSVQVQRPRLTLHVLRLDTLEFHELASGSLPSGASEIAHFNSADFVKRYGVALGRLMRDQFPALHDPANPDHAISLPELGRRPYERQAHLVSAGLKLLALGRNPITTAEVGCGKSTIALSIGGALHPRHFATTVSELRRVGLPTSRLRPVRRILIVCPPHLLRSWTDQAAAVLPEARVVVVQTLSDLAREGDIFLLSRETAKLGSGQRGVRGGRCPRCGTEVAEEPEELATMRRRCSSVARTPGDPVARLAEDLAVALLPFYPADPLVRHLVSRFAALRRSLPELSEDDLTAELARPFEPTRLQPVADRLFAHLEAEILSGRSPYPLDQVLPLLAFAAESQAEMKARCEARERLHAAEADRRVEGGSKSWDESVSRLRHLARSYRDLVRLVSRPASGSATPPAIAALHGLFRLGSWRVSSACGEPLFQAIPSPRRYPLARYILRRCRHLFQLLVLDEAHEFAKDGAAQQKAAHRLVELPGVPTLALSGSLMGGYASSLFGNFWALDREFRQQFRRNDKSAFIARFGYRKVYVPEGMNPEPEVRSYGITTDRERSKDAVVRLLGEAPGILPSFILHHLLPAALVMHKSDLDDELPPCVEEPVAIDFDPLDPRDRQLEEEYRRLATALVRQIRSDRYTRDAGKLWGAMAELPSFLDRCTDDLPPFVLRYPEEAGGAIVAEGEPLPAAWLTPKERWLVERVRSYLLEGRNVLLFMRHTGASGLPKRYQDSSGFIWERRRFFWT